MKASNSRRSRTARTSRCIRTHRRCGPGLPTSSSGPTASVNSSPMPPPQTSNAAPARASSPSTQPRSCVRASPRLERLARNALSGRDEERLPANSRACRTGLSACGRPRVTGPDATRSAWQAFYVGWPGRGDLRWLAGQVAGELSCPARLGADGLGAPAVRPHRTSPAAPAGGGPGGQ